MQASCSPQLFLPIVSYTPISQPVGFDIIGETVDNSLHSNLAYRFSYGFQKPFKEKLENMFHGFLAA